MPYLNVRLSAPPSAALSARVAGILTRLTAEVLHKKYELTSVAVEFVPSAQWFIGAKPVTDQGLTTFYLDVKVTEGTNIKDEKAAYVRQVYAALEAVLGKLHPASYIVIHEVRADAWGYQGATQEYRYIEGRSP